MTDLKDFLTQIDNDMTHFEEIMTFLQDNDWFDIVPTVEDGIVMLSNEQTEIYRPLISNFLFQSDKSIFTLYETKYPLSSSWLNRFVKEEKLTNEELFHLIDFLLLFQVKDLPLYDDTELSSLLNQASFELIKGHGDTLTFFLAWLRTKTKTAYHKDYVMQKRYTMEIQNQAYDMEDYLHLLYFLYNCEYIANNHMYEKAADSMNYTDTWLYLSLHYICSLRLTDLERIYHPTLPYSPEEVIKRIKEGTFTDNDARLVILSINTRMCLLPFTPNKTSSKSGISSVKFSIPDSCEVHIGKLFALAEAHRQVQGKGNMPIIRKISTYQEITRYMGEEIGELFLFSDFRSRSATKSYLQMLQLLADDISIGDNDYYVNGYTLASLARSHKGSFGEFAETTYEYLKDANLSGLSAEFVAFELLERGVLSFIPSMLLKMTTDGNFSKLDAKKQTSLIQTLDMSPAEIESVVSILDKGKRQASDIVTSILSSDVDVLDVLHRIGSGQAFSKEPDCLCLCSAMNKLCPYSIKRQCVGCKYEISTKSTFYLLISEYNRIKALYKKTNNNLEKTKYKKLLMEIILPKMDEMLSCIGEQYGPGVLAQYEQLIKENT